MRRRCFLDSNDLSDLTSLFTEGIRKSDVLVLLGTRNVLTRPWCLLELYEAEPHTMPDWPLLCFPVRTDGTSLCATQVRGLPA